MQIARCKIKEIPELQEFIHNHWKENHILSRNRELFDWQYVKDNKVNFIIAKDRNKIKGMLGFIPQNLFYKKEVVELAPVIWTSMWRSIEDNLGMSLLHCFTELLNPKIIAGGHLSDAAMGIYMCLGYKINYLNVFYMVNQDKKEFKILKNFDGNYISGYRIDDHERDVYFKDNSSFLNCRFVYHTGNGKRTKLISSDVDSIENYWSYIVNRFVKHPIYKYKYITIGKENKIMSVITYRIVPNKCIFIVDCTGYLLDFSNLGHVFQKIMKENNVEYIVFMNARWGNFDLMRSGFMKREEESRVIIPTLFEPFVRENTTHSYCYKVKDKSIGDYRLRIHKGFGDFDRPNE